MHQDHVTIAPEGFCILGSTAKCQNQVMFKPDKYFSVQGHPEYTAGFVQDLIDLRVSKGIFSHEFAASLQVDNPTDSNLIVRVILDFLENKLEF